MELMMSEIRYSKATLPECVRRISERVEEPYRQALFNTYQSMEENSGAGFGQVFQDEMEKCLKQVPIRKQEKELFLQFASGSGFEDGKMQLRSIEQYNDMLKEIISGQDREIAEKSRLAMGLGAMSGLLLIIILL